MAGDSIGQVFKVTSWGESHGPAVGILVEGCPAGVRLDIDGINFDLQRRKPGQSKIVTQRKEDDSFQILSGVVDGITTGTPINIQINNADQRSKDYQSITQVYRPSHADFTYQMKYGIRDVAGGGRSSARITAGHVAAGAIAKQILKDAFDIEILAYVNQVYHLKTELDPLSVTLQQVEANPVRCPDQDMAKSMEELIKSVRKDGDSVGGIITCVIKNTPIGLGEPVFDKLSADLGKAMLSINAVKGFDIGSGFDCVMLKGSEHNDSFISKGGVVTTKTNHAGGVLGGISNGMPIICRIAFKPTATIIMSQNTVNSQGENIEFTPKGRHDPCVLPRAVPIVEAMAAMTLCDHAMRYHATQILR
jgi:chorismate synthase